MRSLFASVFVLVLAGCASGQTITQGGGSSLLDRDYKVNVRGATVGPITIANDLNSGDSLDGLTLANGDRILVKDQSTASQNGIYVVGASPARSSDANSWAELNGAIVAVAAGTANAGNVYVIKTAESGTLGSTNITVEEKGATGAGTGDLLASNNLSDVANATTSRTNLGLGSIATQDSSNVSITGGSLDGIAITGASYDGQINATATFETPATSRTALGLGASDTPTFAGLAGTSLTLGGGASALGLRFLEPSGGGTSYFSLSAPALAGNVTLTLPIDAPGAGEVLGDSNADGALEWITPAGTGDVTAASNFGTDNRLIRSDGTGKGVQASGWTLADSGNLSLSVALNGDTLINATNSGTTSTGISGTGTAYGVTGVSGGAGGIGLYASATGSAGIGVFAEATESDGIPLQLQNYNGFKQSHTFAGTADHLIAWPNLSGVPALSASSLTSTHLIYATTGGAVKGEAALAYDEGTNTLTAGTFAGAGGGLTFDASGMNGNLTTGDNTVQELAQKFDDFSADISVDFDGGGVPLTAGATCWKHVKTGFTIAQATMLADTSGSVVVDVYVCDYDDFDAGATHPVAGDKITASAPPTISAAVKSKDSTLTGWTVAIPDDSVVWFVISSASTVTKVNLTLAP